MHTINKTGIINFAKNDKQKNHHAKKNSSRKLENEYHP